MFRTLTTALLLAISTAGGARADGNHEPIGYAIRDVPLFDAHMHYKLPAWEPYPVESVIELMDRGGVGMAVVSSSPDGVELLEK